MSFFLNEMRHSIVCNTILQVGPFVSLFLCHIRLIRAHVIGKGVTLMTSASSASIQPQRTRSVEMYNNLIAVFALNSLKQSFKTFRTMIDDGGSRLTVNIDIFLKKSSVTTVDSFQDQNAGGSPSGGIQVIDRHVVSYFNIDL